MSLSTGAVSTYPGPVYTENVTIGPAGQLFVATGSEIDSLNTTTGVKTVVARADDEDFAGGFDGVWGEKSGTRQAASSTNERDAGATLAGARNSATAYC